MYTYEDAQQPYNKPQGSQLKKKEEYLDGCGKKRRYSMTKIMTEKRKRIIQHIERKLIFRQSIMSYDFANMRNMRYLS